jgi:hypothetical protein
MPTDDHQTTVTCPHCGDVTEQQPPILDEYVCGECDEPFKPQTTERFEKVAWRAPEPSRLGPLRFKFSGWHYWWVTWGRLLLVRRPR